MSNEVNNLQTRGQLVTAVCQFIQDTNTARQEMVRVALDMAFRKALQSYDWPGLVKWLDSGASVTAGQAYFHAPEDARSLLAVVDATAPFDLYSMDLGSLIPMTQGFVTLQGGPVAFSHVGDVAINTTFASSTALEAVSDGADTRAIWVAGTQAGIPVRKTFTMTSLVAVALGSWDDVTELSVESTDASRTITVRTVAGPVTVSAIRPSTYHTVFKRFRLAAVPGTAATLRLIYRYSPPPIFNDAHIYPLPISNYLMEFAIAASYQSRRLHDTAAQHFSLANEFLLDAIAESERGRVRTPKVGSFRPRNRFITNVNT